MMNKQKLNISSQEEVRFVKDLYIKSFPVAERRPFDDVIDLFEENAFFTVDILIDENKYIGFLTYWKFNNFIYAEHFAIDSTLRNTGYGKHAMQLLLGEIVLPVILEVELPTTIIADRRIGFYQRIGFKYWEHIQYQQPSYHSDGQGIPMKLMTFGNIDLDKDLVSIKSKIYKEVYGV